MKNLLFIVMLIPFIGFAQYPGQADAPGTTAIHKDSSIIQNWATQVIAFNPGKEDTAVVASVDASYGLPENALYEAEGSSTAVVSLGDGGYIILGFEYPIKNEAGWDFAVFENSFSHEYLEFAHVEVSTDGINFVRIPSDCQLDASTQTDTYENSDPTKVHNLAGKYIQGYGTPFELDDIADSTGINLDSINFVKIIDVVGTINPTYGSFDADGDIINDPYPSEFESGGFDLDAIAVIHENRADASVYEHQIEFSIYPNPVQNVMNVIGINKDATYFIYSLDGRLITHGFRSKAEQIHIDQNQLKPGVYLIQFEIQGLKTGMTRFVFAG